LRYFETFCINYEIIIAEHDRESKLGELVSGRTGVLLRFVESENCHSQTKNLNLAAVLAERRILLICDLDVFIPPESLERSLAMVRNGVDFVFPYNGILVQIKNGAIDQDMDLHALMGRLVHFNQLNTAKPPEFDPEVFETFNGTAQGNAFGGIMLCNRRKFFLSGAMNENLHSYGCEDNEFYHRIRKLEYKNERIEDSNAYHYEHVRSIDNTRNNFLASNEAELARIKALEPAELRRYVDDGFKEVNLDTTYDLTVINTPSEYAIKLVQPDRIRLPNSSIVLAFENSCKEDVNELDRFFNFMEAHFDNYSILVIEGEYARFRQAYARKYTRHFWHRTPLSGMTDDELKKFAYTDSPTIEVYRFPDRFDPTKVTDRYDPAKFQVVASEEVG
jgi:Galactosyltransferase.